MYTQVETERLYSISSELKVELVDILNLLKDSFYSLFNRRDLIEKYF